MTRPALLVAVALLLLLGGCRDADAPVVADGDLDASIQPVPDDDPSSPAADPDEDEDEASPAPSPSPTAEPSEEPAPTFDEVCAGRDAEAFIEVLTPRPGATVGDPIEVTGCGNTFEATYLYRLEAADGTVLVEDFGTMTCGNGCVGEFSITIAAGTEGDVLLTVYESSAEDGSAQHVVEVPLTVG